eukprot:2532818-Rhodomonas_salina.1
MSRKQSGDSAHFNAAPAHQNYGCSEPLPCVAFASIEHAPEQNATFSAPSPARSSPSSEDEKGAKPRTRQNKKPVFWTSDEHERFLAALQRFNGGDQEGLGAGVAELVSMALGTRTVSQVRSHAQKYFLRLRAQ